MVMPSSTRMIRELWRVVWHYDSTGVLFVQIARARWAHGQTPDRLFDAVPVPGV